MKFVPKGPVNNIPALVQIMAWRRPGDKPLSEPMMVSLLTHICVNRPQWVNNIKMPICPILNYSLLCIYGFVSFVVCLAKFKSCFRVAAITRFELIGPVTKLFMLKRTVAVLISSVTIRMCNVSFKTRPPWTKLPLFGRQYFSEVFSWMKGFVFR